jgi:nickel-dependent lactate racemase
MLLELMYGDKKLSLEYPDDRVKQILEAKPLPVPASEEDLVREALAHPIDSAPLRELVKPGETACVIVGDMTRVWARYHVLVPFILEELNRGGIPDRDIFIISATGDHRAQTPGEHAILVGKDAYSRVEVFDHDARDNDSLVYVGTTSRGNRVLINRRVAEADRVVITSGIVYHFLAGWGGGKKAIIPGVAAKDTIMKNHSLAFNPDGLGLNPAVCSGRLDGNPLSDDMVQGASLVGPDFMVNTIINEEVHKIARVVAGNYLTAHREGCHFVDRHFKVDIADQAEVVIASCGGYPKDINLYQTYKTLYNSSFALKKGGTLILLSESREGLGNPEFSDILKDYAGSAAREETLRRDYSIGGHMGYHTAFLAEQNDILLISGLPEADVRLTGFKPAESPEEALAFVRKKHGGLPPAYIMPRGGATLPCLTCCSQAISP